ncbi:transposase [Pelorhabdus rhamnosifermentans]|uniref:transposase n=1 Tax=Pelorhabdus rhamnosifermentans TaxID=2772457 RepID=UPI0035E3FF21
MHNAHPDMGYRRIRDELDRYHDIHVNDKRILRIDRALHIQSTIKYKRHGCTRSTVSPEYIAPKYFYFFIVLLTGAHHFNAAGRHFFV